MTKRQFQQFADDLAAKGKLFHFEDDPKEIFNIATGERTFSDIEAEEISKVLAEAFASDFDPMECCLEAHDKYNT